MYDIVLDLRLYCELMMSTGKERLAAMNALLSNQKCITTPAALCEQLDLAGAKPCAVFLNRATALMGSVEEWEHCHDVALKAREYAWEKLHR